MMELRMFWSLFSQIISLGCSTDRRTMALRRNRKELCWNLYTRVGWQTLLETVSQNTYFKWWAYNWAIMTFNGKIFFCVLEHTIIVCAPEKFLNWYSALDCTSKSCVNSWHFKPNKQGPDRVEKISLLWPSNKICRIRWAARDGCIQRIELHHNHVESRDF